MAEPSDPQNLLRSVEDYARDLETAAQPGGEPSPMQPLVLSPPVILGFVKLASVLIQAIVKVADDVDQTPRQGLISGPAPDVAADLELVQHTALVLSEAVAQVKARVPRG